MHVPSVGCGFPPVPSPTPRSSPASSLGELHHGPEGPWLGWGTEEGVPKGAPLASEQPPAPPIPVPTQGTCRCVVRRMRCHLPSGKERVTIPKVPHPWMELNGPLFPSKPVPAALRGGWEQWGGFGCSALLGGARRLRAGRVWCGEAATLPANAPAQGTAAPRS